VYSETSGVYSEIIRLKKNISINNNNKKNFNYEF
jgi:hypothetical protein